MIGKTCRAWNEDCSCCLQLGQVSDCVSINPELVDKVVGLGEKPLVWKLQNRTDQAERQIALFTLGA